MPEIFWSPIYFFNLDLVSCLAWRLLVSYKSFGILTCAHLARTVFLSGSFLDQDLIKFQADELEMTEAKNGLRKEMTNDKRVLLQTSSCTSPLQGCPLQPSGPQCVPQFFRNVDLSPHRWIWNRT